MKVTLHCLPRPSKQRPGRQVWMVRWFDTTGGRRGKTIGVGRITKAFDADAVVTFASPPPGVRIVGNRYGPPPGF